MGLLDKTNPAATRESVILHAKIFGTIASIGSFFYCAVQGIPFIYWLPLVLAASFFGAALGAILEWQLNDSIPLSEVILEIEEEFQVRLSEWETFETVGELHRAVVARLASQAKSIVDESVIWDRLKRLLVKQLGIDSEEVVLDAQLVKLLM